MGLKKTDYPIMIPISSPGDSDKRVVPKGWGKLSFYSKDEDRVHLLGLSISGGTRGNLEADRGDRLLSTLRKI